MSMLLVSEDSSRYHNARTGAVAWHGQRRLRSPHVGFNILAPPSLASQAE